MAPAVVLAPAQGLVIPGHGGGPTRVRHAEPGHRRWRSSRSYLECWRRAAISSSLFIAERPWSCSSLPELLEGPLLIGAPVRRGLLRGRVVLGRSLLAVVAEGGDQFLFVHRRAALELQLSGPLAELLDAALLIGTPVELADLLGGLSLRGLRLLRIRLLLLSLDGFDEVLDSADTLADGGLDRCHSGVDGLYGRVDLAGGDTGDGQRELALDGEGLLGDVEHAVHGADEVDLGDGHPEGAGQLLGDGRPGADGVDHGGLALADGAQQVALRVGVGAGFGRHVCSSQGIRTMRSIVRICMLRQAMTPGFAGLARAPDAYGRVRGGYIARRRPRATGPLPGDRRRAGHCSFCGATRGPFTEAE